MPSWPRTSWDAGDLKQLSASLTYLDSNRDAYARYKIAAQLPLMILGAPGGWTFYPNIVFYGALTSLLVLNREGGILAPLSTLPLLMMVAILSFAYGTIRDTKRALIRLQILRILRWEKGPWMSLVTRPAIAYLESLTEFKSKPGRIKRYLNKMRSLNRADEFFERYSSVFMVLSLATGIMFLFFRVALLALAFIVSIVGWTAIIPISFVVSACADAARNEIPKVWHMEDLRVLGADEDAAE
jgi:hypothetical protein